MGWVFVTRARTGWTLWGTLVDKPPVPPNAVDRFGGNTLLLGGTRGLPGLPTSVSRGLFDEPRTLCRFRKWKRRS
jgi:hypothetical protein